MMAVAAVFITAGFLLVAYIVAGFVRDYRNLRRRRLALLRSLIPKGYRP